MVQSVCADAASFDLPAAVLSACVAEAQSALEVALVRSQSQSASANSAIQSEGALLQPLQQLLFFDNVLGVDHSC